MSSPDIVLDRSVKAIIETCAVQLDTQLTPAGDPADFENRNYTYGSAISLTSPAGGMIFAIICDQASAETLGRLLFAMDEDEDIPVDDIADALNEVANVAVGVMKTRLADQEAEINMGLPVFLEGTASLQHIQNDIRGLGQRLESGNGVSLNVNVIWQEESKS